MPAGVLYMTAAGAVVVRRAGEAVWSPVSGDPGGSVTSASVQAALSADQPGGRTALGLGTAATQAASAFATAAQGTDSREWTAATVDQAEAEAGTATTRRAWTAQRVRQAITAADGGGSPIVADFAALLAIPSPTAGMVRRTAAPVLGTLAQGGIPYLSWVYDGTSWRLACKQTLIADYVPDSGTAGTDEQFLKSRLGAAGLWARLRGWSAQVLSAKSGTTDGATARIRFGADGNASDAIISSAALTAGSRVIPVEHRRAYVDATTLRVDAAALSAGYTGTGGATAYPSDTTALPNMTTAALRLTATVQMAGTSNTPVVAHMIVEAW
jgi:hypothetical protein